MYYVSRSVSCQLDRVSFALTDCETDKKACRTLKLAQSKVDMSGLTPFIVGYKMCEQTGYMWAFFGEEGHH